MRRRILGVLFAALFVALCWAPAAAQEAKPEKPESAESVRYRRGGPPVEGQRYNWRQMAFGGVVVLASAACVIWIVRRQRRD